MPSDEQPHVCRVQIAALALATLDGQVDANYRRAIAMARIAAADRPDIILLPEAFASGYCANDLTPFAETSASPHQREMTALSHELDCMIVYGWIEASDRCVRNVVTVADRGRVWATRAKSNLWPDDRRPWRDERVLMKPGDRIAVVQTRFGRIAAMICYENMLPENWDTLVGRADLVLSLYNCEDDPSRHNVQAAARTGLPSAWANRTGTVFLGENRYGPNPGTAGLVTSDGEVVAISSPGVEHIAIGTLALPPAR